jgi:hypothetical protein
MKGGLPLEFGTRNLGDLDLVAQNTCSGIYRFECDGFVLKRLEVSL